MYNGDVKKLKCARTLAMPWAYIGFYMIMFLELNEMLYLTASKGRSFGVKAVLQMTWC